MGTEQARISDAFTQRKPRGNEYLVKKIGQVKTEERFEQSSEVASSRQDGTSDEGFSFAAHPRLESFLTWNDFQTLLKWN